MPEKKKFVETAKYQANNRYIKENYAQIKAAVPKQEAEDFNNFCKMYGIDSKAGFIREAIKEKMQRWIADEEKKKAKAEKATAEQDSN